MATSYISLAVVVVVVSRGGGGCFGNGRMVLVKDGDFPGLAKL